MLHLSRFARERWDMCAHVGMEEDVASGQPRSLFVFGSPVGDQGIYVVDVGAEAPQLHLLCLPLGDEPRIALGPLERDLGLQIRVGQNGKGARLLQHRQERTAGRDLLDDGPDLVLDLLVCLFLGCCCIGWLLWGGAAADDA